MYQELIRENARLREEVLQLRHELELLRGEGEPEEGRPRVIFIAGRRKGTGARYADRIIKLNRHHRRLLFYLLVEGATDGEHAVPMVHLKRKYRLPTGPTAGRCSELIGKGLVGCHRVPITMQYDAEGVLGYRPATELDPNLGVVKRRRFTYWATEDGMKSLLKEIKPTDDFVRALPSLDILAELKKVIREKSGEKLKR